MKSLKEDGGETAPLVKSYSIQAHSEKASSKMQGYLTVFGGICIHLFCGNLYLWGNIQNYVISHYHYLEVDNGEEKAATLSIGVLVLPLSFCI